MCSGHQYTQQSHVEEADIDGSRFPDSSAHGGVSVLMFVSHNNREGGNEAVDKRCIVLSVLSFQSFGGVVHM